MLYALKDAPVEVAQVGCKGWGLRWLMDNGFPIPPTWVLTATAFERALEQGGAAQNAVEIAWNLNGLWNDWATAQRVLDGLEQKRARVARALRQASLPDELGKRMEPLALMETMWAVRASLVDPLAGAPSLSLLGIPSGMGLWDGVRQVWAAAFRRTVLACCTQTNAPPPQMAVLLQPIAVEERDRSGIAFSEAPDHHTGPMVQAVFGLPGPGGWHRTYVRATGRWIGLEEGPPPATVVTIGEERFGGGTVTSPYPKGDPMTGEEIEMVAQMALQAADVWGGPMAISFFWPQRGKPVIVQIHTDDEVR